MQKTVVVRIESTKEHPKYRRRYRLHKNYKAHVANPPAGGGEYQIGDKVIIEECRPISKEKRWKVIKKVDEKAMRTKFSSSPTEASAEVEKKESSSTSLLSEAR